MGGQLAKPLTTKVTERHSGNSLHFAASGMQGLRREMEDDHAVVPSLEDELCDHSFVAVFDGHGGDATAHIAAETTLGHIRAQAEWEEYVRSSESQRDPALLGRAMRSAFLALDKGLAAELIARQGDASSGSTAVAVMITPEYFVCANVGDSRAVVARAGGQHAALSEDHKPSLPEEAARIEAAGGRVLMDRVDGNLAMSRALGDFDLKDERLSNQCEQKVSPEPSIEILKREPDDEALIVACDGTLCGSSYSARATAPLPQCLLLSWQRSLRLTVGRCGAGAQVYGTC
jgi:serine/threonine protein phosphatase PrpC